MVFYLNSMDKRILSIKLDSGDIYNTIDKIEKKWKELIPDMPVEAKLLNEHFDKIHISERRLGELFIYFSLLAIFIACLGLFGLSSFVIQRRMKEIGIRKVLGSTIMDIVVLLTADFTKWVLIANLVAWPITYYAMRKWLENFVYRTSIDIYTFLLSGLVALSIAIFTISIKTFQ